MMSVVLLGEGYAGATMMAVVRSLGRHDVRVSVFSSHPRSPAQYSRYCRYFRAPDAVRDPDSLQKLLIEHAKVLPYQPLLFPVGDAEVMFLSDRAQALSHYFRFNIATPQLLHGLANKQTQYRIAAEAGVSIPETYFGLNSTNLHEHSVQFPVLIKPAYSHLWPWRGKTKALSAENTVQLEIRLKELESRNIPVVVQSIIPGPPCELYTVVVYISKNQIRPVVASFRKLRHFPLDFGFGSLNETVRIDLLEEQVVQFLNTIAFTGVCGLEFKRDPRDGQFKFIEINARFELAHHLVATAGIDVAKAMYADLAGFHLGADTGYQLGMRWICLTLDLKASRALFVTGDLSFADWMRSMRNVRTEALLTWDDPVPGLYSYGRTLFHGLLPDSLKIRRESDLSAL
jgi:predicted ATP-grasp superfamily ATP-dependent carboligase